MARYLRLDRMQIIGFKSFYGRTDFEFPEGITAVVGPNGCGKSNIGDAISWVLGEQRVSLLRSDRMEDMIFNGSEARRPLGMAEVSLTFRNVAASRVNGNGHGGNGSTIASAGVNGSDHALAIPLAAEIDMAVIEAAPGGVAAIGSATDEAEAGGAEADDVAPVESPAGPEPDGPLFTELPDEVVVTRRLYRSGESEYSLNGRRCRLRDIQDLLARTDIGTRLYSTIEQGKIDQVLVAKPKERRAMFEEAAGILGYKSKRRQAEQKLEAAQANLLRIGDIVAEVDKQIGSLKRQAAKARRYRRLLEDLRERRRAILHRRLLLCDGDRRTTAEALRTLREEDAAAAARLAGEEADLETVRLKLEESEAAARERQAEIHALDLDIDRLQERIRNARQQGGDLTARIDELESEAAALANRAADLETRRTALQAERGDSARRLQEGDAAARAIQAAQDEAAAEIARREAALESQRTALMTRIERFTGLTQRLASAAEQARGAAEALDRIERESADLAGQAGRIDTGLAELERDVEAARLRAAEAAGARDLVSAAAAEAEPRLSEAERAAEEMKGRAAALAERLVTLREMERQHAGFAEGVREILDGAAGCAAQGVVGEGLSVERGLEQAAEAALAGLLEAVLVAGPDEAARGIRHLRSTARGRVSFVSAGAASECAPMALPEELARQPGLIGSLADRIGGPQPGPVAAILKRSLLVETLELALDLHRSHPGFVYITPQGDVVQPDGVVTGGDGRVLQHGILARRAELEDVGRQAAEAVALRDAAEARLPSLRDALLAGRESLRAAEALVVECDRAGFERELQLQNLRGERARIERALPLLRAERERLARAAETGTAEAAALREEAAGVEAGRRGLETDIQEAAAAIASRRADLERVRQQAAEAMARLAAEREKSLAGERELAELERSQADMRATAERRRVEKDECAARQAALHEQEGADGLQLEAALGRRAEAAARDEAAHAGLAYDRSLLHARGQAVKAARAEHEERRTRVQEMELHLARLDADLDHMAATCRDDLAIGLEELRAAAAPEDPRPLEECEAEIESLKTQVEAVGPVNLMAIEQCAELEERFTFLTSQKKDLEDSIEALRDTIRRINRQSRDRFLEAFHAVQGHFQESFRTLFGGGKAELRLQEEESDVLEAGIEIVAQPPGKRLQKIALLSGGEKALTAVALLFALFRYRPSPFCVLDEVDAPLDEANVERFTRLLKALREDTQFILITHNRKSMEAADLLYGVTMEEPGVSKVLPLRFE